MWSDEQRANHKTIILVNVYLWSDEQRSNHKKIILVNIAILQYVFFFWLVLILIQSCHTLYTQLAIETILFWYLSLLYLFGGTVHIKMIKVLIWQNRWKDFLQNWWIYCFIKWFIKWCDFVRRQQQKRWNQSFFLESFFWRKL